MDLLELLTPAETYLLITGEKAYPRLLMKFTFLDLLLRSILKLEKTKATKTTADNPTNSEGICVIAGKNFEGCRVTKFEMTLLGPYFKDRTLRILIRHFIMMGIQNSGGSSNQFWKKVIASPNLKPYFKSDFIRRLIGIIQYTNEGKKAKARAKGALTRIRNRLPHLLKEDPDKLLAILARIKGNVILLDRKLLKELKKIDTARYKALQFNQLKKEIDDADEWGMDWMQFPILDVLDREFDTNFSTAAEAVQAAEAESDSTFWDSSGIDFSCSGYTECSGCGGCSGH